MLVVVMCVMTGKVLEVEVEDELSGSARPSLLAAVYSPPRVFVVRPLHETALGGLPQFLSDVPPSALAAAGVASLLVPRHLLSLLLESAGPRGKPPFVHRQALLTW